MRRLSTAVTAVALFITATVSAWAMSVEGTRTLQYVAAYRDQWNTSAYPHSGEMVLTITNGSISGKYEDTSVKPGGVYSGRGWVSVSGKTDGSSITLNIGTSFTVQGNVAQDGSIDGRSIYRGRTLKFEAKVARVHHGGT